MSSMASPTVFVVPPNASIKCPIHFGVLDNPFTAPCGCTYCKSCIESVIDSSGECPIHAVPLQKHQLRENSNAKAIVDDLLIYCRGGLQRSPKGEWIPCSSGCNMWITLGKRRDHESACAHAKLLLGAEAAPSSVASPSTFSPAPPRGAVYCPHSTHGCLFVGHSQSELTAHQTTCGYIHMVNQIQALTNQIASRDAEILRLNALLAQEARARDFSLPESAHQLLASVTSKLEKLDESSHVVLEEARATLQKTKTKVRGSYQQSLVALTQLRQAVDQARAEIIMKFEEMELAHKLSTFIKERSSSFSLSPSSGQPPATAATTATSTPTSTTSASSDSENVNPQVEIPAPIANEPAEEAVVVPEVVSSPSVPSAAEKAEDLEQEEENMHDDIDDEMREFLLMSKEAYNRELELRSEEELQIQQAVRLSLMEQASRAAK